MTPRTMSSRPGNRGNALRHPDLVALGKSIIFAIPAASSTRRTRAHASRADSSRAAAHRRRPRSFRGPWRRSWSSIPSSPPGGPCSCRPRPLLNADPVAQGAGSSTSTGRGRPSSRPSRTPCRRGPDRPGWVPSARPRLSRHRGRRHRPRGEQTIFGDTWDAATWAASSWDGTSWSGGDWTARTWSGDCCGSSRSARGPLAPGAVRHGRPGRGAEGRGRLAPGADPAGRQARGARTTPRPCPRAPGQAPSGDISAPACRSPFTRGVWILTTALFAVSVALCAGARRGTAVRQDLFSLWMLAVSLASRKCS